MSRPFLLTAAGLAALAYVVVPITLAYANYLSLEVTTMFGVALATYGFARFFQTDRMRFGVLGVLGMSYAAASDWTGFAFDGLVLAGLFVRGFVLGARFGPLRFEPFARISYWEPVLASQTPFGLFFGICWTDMRVRIKANAFMAAIIAYGRRPRSQA